MRPYPDERIGPFDPPPRTVTDRENRQIRFHAVRRPSAERDERPNEADEDRRDESDDRREGCDTLDPATATERLTEMYEAFDPSDRAQGIPPSGTTRIRRWLDEILVPDAHNVVACHEDRAVGHATLVPADEGFELAIFVLAEYQGAGIGTELLRTLLGLGAREGVERVWLSVERWNRAAVGLYEKLGFETSDAQSFELEMAAKLASPD